MRAVKEVQERMGAQAVSGPPRQRVRGFSTRTTQFLRDVRMELRNVTWPSWNDVKATTVVVLVTTFFFGFYLGVALDYPFGLLMKMLLSWGRTLVQ